MRLPCIHCGNIYNHRLTFELHTCSYAKYDNVYTKRQELRVLHKYMSIPMVILTLEYMYNTQWSDKDYWLRRYHRLQTTIMNVNNTLCNSYGTYRVVFAWFLITPLHIIGHNFYIKVRRLSIYDRQRQFLNPMLLRTCDHKILMAAIKELIFFLDQMREVHNIRIPYSLRAFMKQWNKKVRISIV